MVKGDILDYVHVLRNPTLVLLMPHRKPPMDVLIIRHILILHLAESDLTAVQIEVVLQHSAQVGFIDAPGHCYPLLERVGYFQLIAFRIVAQQVQPEGGGPYSLLGLLQAEAAALIQILLTLVQLLLPVIRVGYVI